MRSLEKRLGLSEGTFNNSSEGFNNFTLQAERVINEAQRSGNVRILSEGKSFTALMGETMYISEYKPERLKRVNFKV